MKKNQSGVTRWLMIGGPLLMAVIVFPAMAYASPCHKFPWQYPPQVDEPESLKQAREAMDLGLTQEAVELFRPFIRKHPEGPLTEGSRFAMAVLLEADTDPSEAFLETIRHVRAVRQQFPQSVYGPWALCQIGDLYRRGGWGIEAKATFEQFLISYPNHPLTPGVLIGAGLNFLQNNQNLEAALVFRRVLDQPSWQEFYLEAALGLADGAAASKAWEQARYWYEAVHLDSPELIRASPYSLYLKGLTELQVGHVDQGLAQFLLAFNLHPQHQDAGRALNRLSENLMDQGAELPALWFAYQATKKFPGQEPAQYGQAVLLRWVAKDLLKGSEAHFSGEVRPRLAELGIALPATWGAFRDAAGRLAMVAGPELTAEASFWIAQSFEAQGNIREALASYIRLLEIGGGTPWEQKARVALQGVLSRLHEREEWVEFVRYLEMYREILPVLRPSPELQLMIAEAYQKLELPSQAFQWYRRVLSEEAPQEVHEKARAGEVFMADLLGKVNIVKEAGGQYERTYPHGKWVARVASKLAQVALSEEQIEEARKQYDIVLAHAETEEGRVRVRRKIIHVLRNAGRLDEAIREYQALIREQVANSEDALALADLLSEKGRDREAAAAYEKFTESNDSPDLQLWAQYRLAMSYRKLGKVEKADQLFSHLAKTEAPTGGLGTAILATVAAQQSQMNMERDRARATGN